MKKATPAEAVESTALPSAEGAKDPLIHRSQPLTRFGLGSKLIAASPVEGRPVRILDLPLYSQAFRATYGPPERAPGEVQLPRNWSQVEVLVESRLREFESRHSLECQAAFERGRLEGRREQEEEATRRLEAAAGPWRALQAAVQQELCKYREELYRAAAELAAALSRAWLANVVELNPHVFEAGLRQALEALGDQEEIEVRLHPEDYACYCEGHLDPDAVLAESQALTVRADPQVDRGGALVTSRGGTADARLAVRVQKALEWLSSPHEPR